MYCSNKFNEQQANAILNWMKHLSGPAQIELKKCMEQNDICAAQDVIRKDTNRQRKQHPSGVQAPITPSKFALLNKMRFDRKVATKEIRFSDAYVWIMLFSYAEPKGFVWCYQSHLAYLTGLTPRAMRASIQRLAKAKMLRVITRGGKHHRSNTYWLMPIDEMEQESGTDVPIDAG